MTDCDGIAWHPACPRGRRAALLPELRPYEALLDQIAIVGTDGMGGPSLPNVSALLTANRLPRAAHAWMMKASLILAAGIAETRESERKKPKGR